MRPAELKKDNTLYWVIRTYTSAGVLVDADSTPSVAVRKNGASTADVVTITKRSATTGIYDCSYNPSGEVEGDCFTIEESATISSQAYEQSFSVGVVAAERGTDGANTVAPVDVSLDVAAILADTNELQQNQNNWLTATGFSTFDASTDTVTTDTASRDASKADVSALATQASVDSIDGDVQNIGSDVTTILADTNELQLNQGNWLTATGFSTHSTADVVTAMQAVAGDFKATGFSVHSVADVVTAMQVVANDFKADVSGVATQSSVDVIDGIVDSILLDTNELQGNQGDWATATGFSSHSAADVVTEMQAVSNDFKADVSGLASQASVDVIDSNVDSILADTNELQQNQGDWATATGFNTVAPDNASIASILADTDELQQNQGDWATADTSALARESSVSDIKSVTDKLDTALVLDGSVYQFTANALASSPSGDGAAEIYQYFTDAGRPDLFKADVSDVIRKGVSLRYTNNGTGTGFDDVTITDAP